MTVRDRDLRIVAAAIGGVSALAALVGALLLSGARGSVPVTTN